MSRKNRRRWQIKTVEVGEEYTRQKHNAIVRNIRCSYGRIMTRFFFDGFDYLTCDVEQLEIIGKINTGKANTYKEVSAMATCSIFDKIVINNPKFLEEYVDHMDAVDGSYEWKRLGNADISYATPEESKRMAELRRKRREATK